MPRRGSISQAQSSSLQPEGLTHTPLGSEQREPKSEIDHVDAEEALSDPKRTSFDSQVQSPLSPTGNPRRSDHFASNDGNNFPTIDDRYEHYGADSVRPSTKAESRVIEGLSYDGTGLSDDGRSLTPDPHSSEAETEHIATSDEDVVQEENLTQDYPHITRNGEHDLNAELEEDDIPADLDALSDMDSSARSATSERSDGIDDDEQNSDMEDGEVLEHPSMEEDEAANDESNQYNHAVEARDYGAEHSNTGLAKYGIINSSMVPDESTSDGDEEREEAEEEVDAEPGDDDDDDDESDDKIQATHEQGRNSDGRVSEANSVVGKDLVYNATPLGRDGRATNVSSRKRTHSPEISPGNTKRLAPRKVQAELDSDEEVEGSEVPNGDIVATVDMTAIKSDVPAKIGISAPEEDVSKEIELETVTAQEEVEEEEIEEEAQDDTEREERNKHRQAAMEALRTIETEFTKLRAKLYEERIKQIDGEIALAEDGAHPLIVEKTAQNQIRHSGRIRRAETLRARRMEEADKVFNACKFVAHSQFSQDRQKLRATLLSKTSAEWFQIHREKRVIDMAVPEYGYLVPDRRSVQVKQRREYEAEISILAGLKSFIGFPAAPSISTASGKDIEADLAEMGITKTHVRDNSKHSHASRQQTNNHSHLSMTTHLNHHTHNTHTHAAHSTAHGKSHHRKPASSAKQRSAADKSDHHTQAHHLHQKNASPKLSSRPPFHTHAYQGEIAARKADNPQASYAIPNDVERKPILHPLNSDPTPLDPGREKLPFGSHKLAQPQQSNFHQGNGSLSSTLHYEQKQAQNLPNILRQDAQDTKSKQLPGLAHLGSGTHHSNLDYLSSNGSKSNFAAQFWSPKLTDTTRTPAPAMSSNSAFNATLSQPGSSASYIPPPRAYSPAGQHQPSIYKPGQNHINQAQHNPPKHFQANSQFSSQPKDATAQNSPLFHPKAQQVPPGDVRVLFGPPLPPRQES